MARENGYTFEKAFDEAVHMLEERFGKAEQQAAVLLAQALFAGMHYRSEFIREHDKSATEPPYTG